MERESQHRRAFLLYTFSATQVNKKKKKKGADQRDAAKQLGKAGTSKTKGSPSQAGTSKTKASTSQAGTSKTKGSPSQPGNCKTKSSAGQPGTSKTNGPASQPGTRKTNVSTSQPEAHAPNKHTKQHPNHHEAEAPPKPIMGRHESVSEDNHGRPTVLFDLNGVLIQARQASERHPGRLHPFVPRSGLEHLLSLRPFFRIGLYTSATEPTLRSRVATIIDTLESRPVVKV